MKPLLSICIPTFNRAKFLNDSLSRIRTQYANLSLSDRDLVELIVSDNCSPDNTKEVCDKHIEHGLNATYYRNTENIGGDRNFLQCIHKASGHFIWLLGDDDYFMDNTLKRVLDVLKNNPDAGLVHLNFLYPPSEEVHRYNNPKEFLLHVTYFITFMSANIFNKEYATKEDLSNYIGSYFIKCTFYLSAAWSAPYNVYVNFETLEDGKDFANNGGFNIWKVFIDSYLTIQKNFIPKKYGNSDYFKQIKRVHFIDLIAPRRYNLIVCKQKSNYIIEGFWKYFFKYYRYDSYTYAKIIKQWIKHLIKR